MYNRILLAEETAVPSNPLIPQLPDVFWSVVVLVIIGFTLGKIIVPRFLKVLDERTEKIEGGLKRAELAQEEANETLERFQDQLNKARDEAAQIKDEARSQAQALIEQGKALAQTESDKIIAANKIELEFQRRQIITELRTELGKNSIILAEKLINHSLSEETKKSETVNRFINELEVSR